MCFCCVCYCEQNHVCYDSILILLILNTRNHMNSQHQPKSLSLVPSCIRFSNCCQTRTIPPVQLTFTATNDKVERIWIMFSICVHPIGCLASGICPIRHKWALSLVWIRPAVPGMFLGKIHFNSVLFEISILSTVVHNGSGMDPMLFLLLRGLEVKASVVVSRLLFWIVSLLRV